MSEQELREALIAALRESPNGRWLVLPGPVSIAGSFADALLPLIREREARAVAEADDERAAKRIAADAADRFRDVLSECLGHPDENPGDDALVSELRAHFGKTGPEPTRWREFCAGALAMVDQINADRLPDPAQVRGTGGEG